MLDNYKLIILAGGFHRCDPSWSKTVTGVERCYKLYIPTAGAASVTSDMGVVPLKAGHVYFISGFRLKSQSCPKQMDVHWLHFMPESLYLRYLLDQIPPIQHWPGENDGWTPAACAEISRMFPPATDYLQPLSEDMAPATSCCIQGLLLGTVARLLRTLDAHTLATFHPRYYQLKPALDYMQTHYQTNPSLGEIARQVHLAPTYFHRQFTALFKGSPFDYMLNQRLNRARHLLSSTSVSIKEIAESVGYDNPLYFSRVFTAQMALSPSRYRAQNQEAAPARARAGA